MTSIIYPWQNEQWQQLLTRKNHNTLPHALMLVGAEGMGKLIFAQSFAQLLLCEQAHDKPCGQCRSCCWFQAGTHPDFLLIQPEASGKTIKIDQIRELVEEFAKTSQCNGYQIAIIAPAEAMNNAAANALLKILEEPSGKVIIILVSHHFALLPATIRSRCQKIIFKNSEKNLIKDWVQTKLSNSSATAWLALTEYAPLKAVALAQADQQQYSKLLQDFLQLCMKKTEPLKVAATYTNAETKQLLSILLKLIMDFIRVKFTQDIHFFYFPEKIDSVNAIAKNVSLNKLLKWQEKITESLQLLYKNVNLNQQLMLENLFISIAEI